MAIARIDEFLEKLKAWELEPVKRRGMSILPFRDPMNKLKTICNHELDYLRNELEIETIYSSQGYPCGVLLTPPTGDEAYQIDFVKGDARRLKTQISSYRKAIKSLELNSQNSTSQINRYGEKVKVHKALRYFNLAKQEKNDVNTRDRALSQTRQNKPS